MFAWAAEQGFGKGAGKFPSPRLWVSGEEEVNPRLNLTSAVVSSTGDKGGQPSAWGQDWTQTASPVTCHHLAEPSHPWHRVSDKP